VTKGHVLQALAEHDTRGAEAFLEAYGFAPLAGYAIVHEGRRYDLPAVLGVAHRYATGRLATAEEISGDLGAAVAILRRRGVEVSAPAAAVAPAAARASAARAPRAAKTAAPRAPRATTSRRPTPVADRPAAVCPTCSMALPGTGICDNCS
jgi:hypothetical protein